MYERELFDETLDINSTNNYEISIQVSLNGFSFSLLDTLRNRFVMLRDYKLSGRENDQAAEVNSIINQDDFLTRPYHRYRIVFITERNTLVPAGLFDPAVSEQFFRLNHILEEGYSVSNNRINKPDSFLLFDLRNDLKELLLKSFPEASLSHHLKPLLAAIFGKSGSENHPGVYINIEDTYFNIVVTDNSELKFINTFRYRNSSDLLYFLMYSFEKLKIGKDVPVNATGMISRGDELYTNLSRYVSTVKLTKPAGPWSTSYVFDSLEMHRYSNLFNIITCA